MYVNFSVSYFYLTVHHYFIDLWSWTRKAGFRKTGQWTEGEMWSNRKTCSGTENGRGEETHRGNAVLEKNKPAAESKQHLLSSG